MEKLSCSDVVAVIAGGGDAPKLVLSSLCAQNIPHVIAAINENADSSLLENTTHQWFGVGEIRRLLKFCKSNNVNKVVFIGSIARPSFSSLKLDLMGMLLAIKYGFGRLTGGDNQLLTTLIKLFENNGYIVIAPESINPDLIAPYGVLGKIKPNKVDIQDIEIGLKVLESLGELDVGQSVIVEGKYVLGIEAAEGTANLIKRCKLLRKHKNKCGVLVKVRKSGQDTRIDLPAIGVKTIDEIADSGLRGVAIKSGSTLVIDVDKIIERANHHKIFVIGL